MVISLTPEQKAIAKDIIATDDSLLPLFPPLERAAILAIKEYFKDEPL